MHIMKVPKKLKVVLSWNCNTILWGGNPPPPPLSVEILEPSVFSSSFNIVTREGRIFQRNFYSLLFTTTYINSHQETLNTTMESSKYHTDSVTEPSRKQSLCVPLKEMPRNKTINVNPLTPLINTSGFWTNSVITKHEYWLSIDIHIEGLGGELSESFRKSRTCISASSQVGTYRLFYQVHYDVGIRLNILWIVVLSERLEFKIKACPCCGRETRETTT